MKPLDTIDYRGCKICIHQDETPENPFESWDCEPPLLTLYTGRHEFLKSYNDAPESWSDILWLLPKDTIYRGNRVAFIKEHILPLGLSMRDVADEHRRTGCIIEALSNYLNEHLGDKPTGYSSAIKWMEAAAAILTWGGITAVFDKSRGYCQGDVTLCLAVATPAWAELVGAPADSHKAQLKSAIELYGAWAWGDVYGWTLEDEDGNELDDSCWGYYGRDHDKSGLLEAAQAAIDSHLSEQAETAAALESAFAF